MSPKKIDEDWGDYDEYFEDDPEETSEDWEDDGEDLVEYVKRKGKNMPKEQTKPITADDYFSAYPQDRRSREEINTLIEKNKEYLKKLSGNSSRSEKKRALMVAVHVDFENRVSKLPLV